MADEVVREFPLGKGRFTSENAAAAGRKGGAVTAENFSIKRGLIGALDAYARRRMEQAREFARESDNLGLKVFLLEMLEGTGEDRRAVLGMVRSMLPVEFEATVDASLTVRVMTMVGEHALDISNPKRIREVAVTPPAHPIALEHDREPRDPA